jgi:hypothetical protein
MRSIRNALLGAATFCALAMPACATSYSYIVVDTPATPGLLATVVTGINNVGLATGYSITAGPGPLGTYAGFTVNTDGSNFTPFTRPYSSQTGASGLNDLGQITGVSVDGYGNGVGFLRSADGTSYTNINPNDGGLPTAYAEAIGIRNDGTIVGFYADHVGATPAETQVYSQGFIYSAGVYSEFTVPLALGFGPQLVSINMSNVISGNLIGVDMLPHGFLYSDLFGFVLPAGPAPSQIGTVNDFGSFPLALLSYDPLSPFGYGADSYVVSGSDYARIAPHGALGTQALGLNNRGQVTGVFYDLTGVHGFIASPTPEPSSWAMMLAGFGLLGASLRRRAASPLPLAGGVGGMDYLVEINK